MKNLHLAFLLFFTSFACQQQTTSPKETEKSDLKAEKTLSAQVAAGPMLGYTTMMEAQIWLQTTAPSAVALKYYDSMQEKWITLSGHTHSDNAHTIHFTTERLEPGQHYPYEIYLEEEKVSFDYPLLFKSKPLWQWRRDAPDFRFATGSCAYGSDEPYDRPGKPYGGDYQIYEHIHQKNPDFMLWLGDNIYLRESDWNSKNGIYYRYSHQRSLAELQPLLAHCPHYAIWDDHDFGPNDADRSFSGKATALAAFKDFWANPQYGLGQKDGSGITGTFEWSDAQFFLMDNRYFRSPNKRKTGDRSFLGKDQVNWLIDALSFSQANFKFIAIGGQVLNSVQTKENYSNFPEELNYLISEIKANQIDGVIFLTGDRHFSELSILKEDGLYPLHDFTVSPLNSGGYTPNENNTNRIAESLITERNFATFQVSGKKEERRLEVQYYDANGKDLWSYQLMAKDLKH